MGFISLTSPFTFKWFGLSSTANSENISDDECMIVTFCFTEKPLPVSWPSQCQACKDDTSIDRTCVDSTITVITTNGLKNTVYTKCSLFEMLHQ